MRSTAPPPEAEGSNLRRGGETTKPRKNGVCFAVGAVAAAIMDESDRSLGAASRSSRFSGSGASSRKSGGFDGSGSTSRDSIGGGGRRRRPRSPSPVGLDRGGMPDRGVSRSSGKSQSSKSKPPPVTVRSSHHPNKSDSTLLQSSSSRSGRHPPQDQHRRNCKSVNKHTQSSLTNSTHATSASGELWS